MIICNECLCDKCLNNVDNTLKTKGNISCLNCDECYYYGLDDDTLRKNIKYDCNNFCTDNPKIRLIK